MSDQNDKSLDFAKKAIESFDASLVSDFLLVAEFILEFPEQVSRPPKNLAVGGEKYLERIAKRFADGREVKPLAEPGTVPDPVVSLVLKHGYGVASSQLERIRHEHQLSMLAENTVGELLERYISSVVAREGWVWVSGAIIKAVDFIRKSDQGWDLLQVKNRDNSENSSSSAIRNGTEIKKWHRTKSKTGETKWEEFPLEEVHTHLLLTEDEFQSFVIKYVGDL